MGSTIEVVTPSTDIGDNNYGTLDSNYVQRESIWLKTRDYIRRPRENFEGETRVQYYWRWLTDDKPEFFMYDFSGEQLETTGDYAYIGPKPLTNAVLNRKPNRLLENVDKPELQQTIFDRIKYDISYLNDDEDVSSEVEPIQLFIGFKSDDEGAFNSTLQLFKKEDIIFDIDSNIDTNLTLKTEEVNGDRFGTITINTLSNEVFTDKGLKSGQRVVIYLKDLTNNRNQYISDNTASVFIIRQVYTKMLVLDFIQPTDELLEENTVVTNYPSNGNTTYLRFTLKVADKELARINVMGQTEEEDERFKIELGNLGKLINPDEVFIFKNYDILEGGIDWTILNKKRKEMLMMKHLIYPYIGSYKSIINAINYFGYNDLQLNEYYRNVDSQSENFSKLFKVEIPDIFDNTVEGWEESDFIRNTYPNDKFEETNLFNLTYRITDKDGNNVLNYSLDEVIIKLQGLKYWLKRNIIPLTHRIMDITGIAYLNTQNSIQHKVHDIRIINLKQEMCPISFKLNEAYLMPVNSGSTVYNCVLDFYTIIPNVGTERNYLLPEIKPFNGSKLILPDYFNVKIRTYKTYKEWAPFTTYNKGEKVSYYDRLYESVIDNNRIKNPRRYENVTNWSANTSYRVASIVKYQRDYYVFSGLGNDIFRWGSSITPGVKEFYTSTGDFSGVVNQSVEIYYNSIGEEDIFNSVKIGSIIEVSSDLIGKWVYRVNQIDIIGDVYRFSAIIQSVGISITPSLNSEINSGFNLNVEPTLNSLNWLNITEWREIDKEPVQTITEFRTTDNLLPFNFTIDSNLDPFITIEVTSDNGYGQIYSDRKNYEIRGIKDLVSNDQEFDQIGPFEPIEPLYGESCPVLSIGASQSSIGSNIYITITNEDGVLTIINEYYQSIFIGGEGLTPYTEISPGNTFEQNVSTLTDTGRVKIKLIGSGGAGVECIYCLNLINNTVTNIEEECDDIIIPVFYDCTLNEEDFYCFTDPLYCDLSNGYCYIIEPTTTTTTTLPPETTTTTTTSTTTTTTSTTTLPPFCVGNLLSNPTFDTDLSGWDNPTNSWTWSSNGGLASALYTGIDELGSISQNVLTDGESYNLSFTLYNSAPCTEYGYVMIMAGNNSYGPYSTPGPINQIITCSGSSTFSIMANDSCEGELGEHIFVDDICLTLIE